VASFYYFNNGSSTTLQGSPEEPSYGSMLWQAHINPQGRKEIGNNKKKHNSIEI
jgi:hypothetical protein